MEPELLTYYKEKVVPKLKEQLAVTNVHQIPGIEKVVVQSCMGSESDRKQAVEDAAEEIARITGQQPITVNARRSVSNFSLRAGEPLGAKVTLRGRHMWEFLQRLIFTAIPSIRDFRGVPPKSFDGRGNFALGIADQTIFPEVELDRIKRNIGFDVIIVTTARTDDEGRALLTELGMPFRKPRVADQAEAAA